MKRLLIRVSATIMLGCVALGAQPPPEKPAPPPRPTDVPKRPDRPPDGRDEGDVPMGIKVESSAFAPDAPIPSRHTGDGDDVSPPLKWSGVPDGTRQLALIMDDPDAPSDEPWVHWVIYGIPGTITGLKENIAKSEQPGDPAGAVQGKNSFGKIGYGGPAPPRGHGVHHYHFKVYALGEPIDAKPGLTKKDLLEKMKGRILAQGELIGTYERKK
jgi:hypothetical protein